jgi:hypothetical protein
MAGFEVSIEAKVRKSILRAIRAGSYIEPACAAAGVGYSTYREWVNRYPEFAEAVERAQAGAEVGLVGDSGVNTPPRTGEPLRNFWRAATRTDGAPKTS